MKIQNTLLLGIHILLDDNGTFWRWWYRLTMPSSSLPGISFAEREMFRRARLASAILFFTLLITLLALPIFLNNPNVFPLFLALIGCCLAGIMLNRRKKIMLVGILLIATLEIGFAVAILTTPQGINVYSLPLFDSMVTAELIAVSLLPPLSVFGVMIINSIFICATITFLPHSPEVGQVLATMGYALFTRPIFLHLSIAIVTYLWVHSATQAMQRADRAEEIANLQKTIAEQNQQRIEALQTEQNITLAYEQQRTINALKDQFLIHVSHELRTPLTALGGFLELIKMYDLTLDTATRTSFLLKSIESFNELSDMVTSVLDVTTLAAEFSPKPKAVPLGQSIQEVLDRFDPQEIQAHIIYLNVAEHIKVWADRHYLHQIIHHLVSNALKYSPQQSAIRIEVQSADSPSTICICIEDEGAGIPPKEIPFLFEKFVRLERDLASATRGLGLGLYIAKTMVEAMQGQIWIESTGRTDEGSRIYFTLPSA